MKDGLKSWDCNLKKGDRNSGQSDDASVPFEKMRQIEGQIGLFDAKPFNKKNECLGEPCMHCDVEWCSAKCFIRRGYMWDGLHRFVKGSDGKPLRKHLEDRICKVTRFDLSRKE